ncbi:hypothetical protein CN681_12905 [Bacillus toyonensis]|uniref:hypothetical protein n=1 Tax=Bacillus cereus group TaxID=86661 RepID=UPI000BEFCC8F|nr:MULTISPECIES: hypothetical protein [Bacillus cereus group]MDA2407148.1 hypothetical protein [Bacillus cereus]PEK09863.1 hypothetical protein CN681_12905 [Bacillus toyonensis]PGV39152.1 hypothetical protein COD74_26705 [Bacillus cereus]
MTAKEKKFQVLLEKRMKKAMKQLDLIANLSSGRYACSPVEANELVDRLDSKVKYIDGLFQKRLFLNSKKK